MKLLRLRPADFSGAAKRTGRHGLEQTTKHATTPGRSERNESGSGAAAWAVAKVVLALEQITASLGCVSFSHGMGSAPPRVKRIAASCDYS